MNSKIIANIFNYATAAGAEHLVIASRNDQVALDCHLPDGTMQTLSLPKKLEPDFFNNLRQILAIAPGALLAREYRKMTNRHGHWQYYLSVLPDGWGEKIVISLVNRPDRLWRLNQLGLQKIDLQELKQLSRCHSGLVIVSAPPQQGKSTTLYALLELWDRTSYNTYALSADPPADLPGVNFLPPTAASWEKIMHHDSDIIIADNLDDEKARYQAWRAAASGRLVLGAMTATSALAVLTRLWPMPLTRQEKLESLRLIINQRLADLKRPGRLSGREGGRRQIGLFEIWKLSPEIKSFIAQSRTTDLAGADFTKKLASLALVSGFRPISVDESQKIKEGLI
ncbi:MAG: ATPase, T2SS/T4P/T4SS family [Patescibacteria group bacterium]